MNDFDDYPFSLPKIRISTWIFRNFSSQVKIRYWRQPLVKFLQQLNEYSKNELVLNLIDDFLTNYYTSQTTKSSHFVSSITSQNFNQFQENLVC